MQGLRGLAHRLRSSLRLLRLANRRCQRRPSACCAGRQLDLRPRIPRVQCKGRSGFIPEFARATAELKPPFSFRLPASSAARAPAEADPAVDPASPVRAGWMRSDLARSASDESLQRSRVRTCSVRPGPTRSDARSGFASRRSPVRSRYAPSSLSRGESASATLQPEPEASSGALLSLLGNNLARFRDQWDGPPTGLRYALQALAGDDLSATPRLHGGGPVADPSVGGL